MKHPNDEPMRSYGLSGDHGWHELDEPPLDGVDSVMLLAATAVYFGALWLMSGLAPLSILASHLRGHTQADPSTRR